MSDYRIIPSIEQLRQRPVLRALESRYGRKAIVGALREETERLRQRLADGAASADRPSDASGAATDLERAVERRLRQLFGGSLRPVINATGVIVHTNLGRAPLSGEAIDRLVRVARGYSNLEFDLATGRRGRRDIHANDLLARLTGAEAALVVNNNAAATLLILSALAREREVVISRGELVQIGGGFRIGEILEASGARLREIGATNKTTLRDYAQAIGPETAMILKVHRSNFSMSGFVESPSSNQIAALAKKKRVPLVEDLGSGAIAATESLGIDEHEPTPTEALKAGADLVCFSGDKLFGGPQAGIIIGKRRFVTALQREPLFRALRCDKLCLAALQTTVDLHLEGQAGKIPALAVLQASEEALRARGAAIASHLANLPLDIEIGRGQAKTGGGTLPRSKVPSVTLEIVSKESSLAEFAGDLRTSNPPVIGYIADNRFKLDLRTIFPQQDDLVIEAIRAVCTK